MVFAPHYTITLKDEAETQVHFLFNNWALKLICKRLNLELWQFQNRVAKTAGTEGLDDVKGLGSPEDLEAILLASNESYCRHNNIPFTATEFEASTWIDAMGGVFVGNFTGFFTEFFAHIFNVDPSKVLVETEKKSVEA